MANISFCISVKKGTEQIFEKQAKSWEIGIDSQAPSTQSEEHTVYLISVDTNKIASVYFLGSAVAIGLFKKADTDAKTNS